MTESTSQDETQMLLIRDRWIDETGTIKEHRYLIDEMLERGFLISIPNPEDEGFDLEQSCNYDEVLEACEAVDECTLWFVNPITGQVRHSAYIVHDYGEKFTVNDYNANSEILQQVLGRFKARVDP